MFSQNIVWKRLDVQEGRKTRLSITEEKRVICFCPVMLLKHSWRIWTVNTSQMQEHNSKHCNDNNQWCTCGQTLRSKHVTCAHTSSYFHFSSHAKATGGVKDADECWWANTTRPDSFQRLPPSADGPSPGQYGRPHQVCFWFWTSSLFSKSNYFHIKIINVISISPLLNLVNNTLNCVGVTIHSRELSKSKR